MIEVKVSDDKRRKIAAIFLVIVAAVVFILYPDAYSGTYEDVPVYASYFLPCFLILVFAVLILDIRINNFILRTAAQGLLILAVVTAMLYGTEILAGRHIYYITYNPLAFWLNIGYILSVATSVYALAGKIKPAMIITALVVMLFCITNYFVTLFRGTPLVPTDLLAIGTAMDVVTGYKFTFSFEMLEALLTFFAAVLLSCRLELLEDIKERRTKYLIRGGAVCAVFLFVTQTVDKDFIMRNHFQPNYWEQHVSRNNSGSILNFIAFIGDAQIEKPEHYSLDAVAAIANRYASDVVSEAEVKPDVIMILGESWADMAPEGYVRTARPALTYIPALAKQDNSMYHNLIVSTMGAGTSVSEFQVLTGVSKLYGMGQSPFQMDVGSGIPNLAALFKQLGYEAVAIHTGSGSAWSRDKAFPVLGFDVYLAREDLDNGDESLYSRYFPDDSLLYDHALRMLDTAKSPMFMHVLTVQTHGGYEYKDYDNAIPIESPAGEYPWTEQFLGALSECEMDLQAFIEQLEGRDRPTLVMFYGDHIPAIEDSYLKEVVAPSDDLYAYKTFYGAWANYELPELSVNKQEYLSINYLYASVMANAKLPLTGYQKFLLESADAYPVISVDGLIDSNGDVVPLERARETVFYQEQSVLQYNLMEDRDRIPEGFYYYAP